jgi:uncharacterized protein
MATRDDQDRRTAVRKWLVPLTLITGGIYAWACVDDPDLSDTAGSGASGDTDGDETADDSDPASTTGQTSTGSASTTGGSADVTVRDVLESIALRVIVPSTATFESVATELQATVDLYAAAVAADPAAAAPELATARVAWREAMGAWQRLEVMQIGPAAPSTSAIAGENLRDETYSWPTVDTCTVDRRLVGEDYAADDFFVSQLVVAYGLDALEYLLFVHDQNHTCPSQVQLDGPWSGLGFDEIQRRRGAYALRVAQGIADRAEALATRWSPEGDDFAALLANPGPDSPFDTETIALDDVFRAMFYVDKQTKDAKLGRPLGIQEGCASPPCANLFESPFGSMSAAAIAENLEALELLVVGGSDPGTSAGFDDLLINADHLALANELLGKIDVATAMARGLEQPLQQLVVTDPAQVQALYDAVKDVTDILKGPFVMTLMLTIPAEGAGDVD